MTTAKIVFPKVTDADMAFGGLRIPDYLIEEAKKLGFGDDNNPYNKLFNKLFFKGGHLPNYLPDVPQTRRDLGRRYLVCLMHGMDSKHEDKEAVCAYIMSELFEHE